MFAYLAIIAAAVVAIAAQSLPPCYISMGDWGYPDANVISMGKQINDVAANPGNYGCASVDFVFALGDNFYNSGVSSITDPMWESTFVQPFRSLPALAAMPFYAMVGDHDYGCENPSIPPNHTRAQAQVEYHYKVDSNWILPSTNYTFRRSFSNGVDVLFVVLDMQATYSCVHTPEWCFLPDQLQWLDNVLTQADGDASIAAVVIAGHYAVVCPGGGHFDPTIDNQLVPLGRQHRVSLFLTGHAHYLAWSRESSLSNYTNGQMWYMVNGAGRGAGAYECSWTNGLPPWGNPDVALPTDEWCCTNSESQDGLFVIHRVHPGGFEHCALDSLSGSYVRDCQMTTYRS